MSGVPVWLERSKRSRRAREIYRPHKFWRILNASPERKVAALDRVNQIVASTYALYFHFISSHSAQCLVSCLCVMRYRRSKYPISFRAAARPRQLKIQNLKSSPGDLCSTSLADARTSTHRARIARKRTLDHICIARSARHTRARRRRWRGGRLDLNSKSGGKHRTRNAPHSLTCDAHRALG